MKNSLQALQTAMEDENIIAVFDAKTTQQIKVKKQMQKQGAAYLTDLDTNFGALFFPEYDYRDFVYPPKN
ncbi:MAG: hypothetical protein WBL88_00950, partial [Nitrososphaeraceae archaeon]